MTSAVGMSLTAVAAIFSGQSLQIMLNLINGLQLLCVIPLMGIYLSPKLETLFASLKFTMVNSPEAAALFLSMTNKTALETHKARNYKY